MILKNVFTIIVLGVVAVTDLAVVEAASVNPANDYLLHASPKERANRLGRVVGEGCRGTTSFYMGIVTGGFAAGSAFWSLRCFDKRTYSVQVKPDGSGTVLECSVLAALNAGKCFESFPAE